MIEKTEKPKRTFFVSYQVRLLVGFTLAFSIVFAGAYYWFYNYSTDIAMKRIEEDLLDTLKGAIAGVDVDDFVALAEDGVIHADGYTDDPRYWEHIDWLAKVNEIEPRAQAYSYVHGIMNKEVVFIGSVGAVIPSPSGDPPPWGAKFKERYISSGTASANLITGFDHVGATTETYEDKWGHWISGWGPIVNSKGEKVGAIGVDFRADYVKEVQQGIKNRMVTAFVVTYIILLVLVYAISTLFTRPIVSLTHTAERIGDGDYEQDLSNLTKGRFRDEVGTLAGVFQIMVDKVRQRETSLRARVAQLEIMIDRSKLETQVQEIVESDFFQELRSKVQDMRSRFRDGPAPDNDQEK